MARKDLIGLTHCPECDNEAAEVRPDKNGLAYRYCPACGSQYFTRAADQDRRLRAKMRPVPGAAPTPAPAPAPKAEKRGGLILES